MTLPNAGKVPDKLLSAWKTWKIARVVLGTNQRALKNVKDFYGGLQDFSITLLRLHGCFWNFLGLLPASPEQLTKLKIIFTPMVLGGLGSLSVRHMAA